MSTPDRRKPARRAEALLWGILATVVTSLAFGGWTVRDFVSEKLASKDDVIIAQAKADFVLDRQMEAIIGQIAYLERKAFRTPTEQQQLNFLREQLAQMRRVRAGK